MSENNNDSVEAPEIEKIEEPTPAVEATPEVVEVPVVEEKAVEEAPVVEKKAKKEVKAEANGELVALFSKGNLNWTEVGKLVSGYNLVSKNDADKWLKIKNVRLATPEEIATKAVK
jgi:hypothetical protein